MPRKRYSTDQIIPMFRHADVELGQGGKVPEVCKLLGIAQQTYYLFISDVRSMAVCNPRCSKN